MDRINIKTLAAAQSDLPPRVRGLVIEWATLHQEELLENWELAAARKPLKRIAPLE